MVPAPPLTAVLSWRREGKKTYSKRSYPSIHRALSGIRKNKDRCTLSERTSSPTSHVCGGRRTGLLWRLWRWEPTDCCEILFVSCMKCMDGWWQLAAWTLLPSWALGTSFKPAIVNWRIEFFRGSGMNYRRLSFLTCYLYVHFWSKILIQLLSTFHWISWNIASQS